MLFIVKKTIFSFLLFTFVFSLRLLIEIKKFIFYYDMRNSIKFSFLWKFLFVFILFSPLKILAQNYMWWNEIHHWNGYTVWYNYLTFSPAYMGPNALPVPEIKTGNINQNIVFSQNFVAQQIAGDLTLNLEDKLCIPLSKNVALIFFIVPLEYYKTDTLVRDRRAARERSGKGFAAGDLNIATLVQLFTETYKRPSLLLSINLRTASGGKMISARYTDAPGYYFDFSSSKQFNLNNSFKLKFYAQIGFYVWQTNLPNYPQDDAWEYGVGTDILYKKLIFKNQIGGYSGYLKNGDEPVVQRIIFKTNFDQKINFDLKFQKGWRDFKYNSLFLGMNFSFPRIASKKMLKN